MKAVISVFFVIGMIAIIVCGMGTSMVSSASLESDFLRIHVRANSNSDKDQQIKYEIKDKVVVALTPIFASVLTKEQAIKCLNNNLNLVEEVANKVLCDAGFDYTARAVLREEYFPTRDYGSYSLPEGVYDALILNLGDAEGANWWCVIYPPLCFLDNNSSDTSTIKYRSKLQEIIKRYF